MGRWRKNFRVKILPIDSFCTEIFTNYAPLSEAPELFQLFVMYPWADLFLSVSPDDRETVELASRERKAKVERWNKEIRRHWFPQRKFCRGLGFPGKCQAGEKRKGNNKGTREVLKNIFRATWVNYFPFQGPFWKQAGFFVSFRIYTSQFLEVTQCRVPDSVSEQSPLVILAAVALAARLGSAPQLCPHVLVAALPAYGRFIFFPSCYSGRETMLSPSYRPLFRNWESIFSLLKGHEEQRGSERNSHEPQAS